MSDRTIQAPEVPKKIFSVSKLIAIIDEQIETTKEAEKKLRAESIVAVQEWIRARAEMTVTVLPLLDEYHTYARKFVLDAIEAEIIKATKNLSGRKAQKVRDLAVERYANLELDEWCPVTYCKVTKLFSYDYALCPFPQCSEPMMHLGTWLTEKDILWARNAKETLTIQRLSRLRFTDSDIQGKYPSAVEYFEAHKRQLCALAEDTVDASVLQCYMYIFEGAVILHDVELSISTVDPEDWK